MESSALRIVELIEVGGNSIYAFQALLAIWGIYNVLLLYRGIKKKRLADAQAEGLIAQVRDLGLGPKAPNPEAAVAVCQNPPYWHTALAQLVAVALRNRHKGLAKVKQLLVMEFHTVVISKLENRLASVATAAKIATLLGLLGTVLGMIAAFGRMGEGQKADPSSLAGAISLALWTTAIGLIIASPLLMFANDIQGRLRHLRDETERQLSDFLEILEHSEPRPAAAPRTGSGTHRAVLPR
jgi:biopolymer transport protein ExbB